MEGIPRVDIRAEERQVFRLRGYCDSYNSQVVAADSRSNGSRPMEAGLSTRLIPVPDPLITLHNGEETIVAAQPFEPEIKQVPSYDGRSTWCWC